MELNDKNALNAFLESSDRPSKLVLNGAYSQHVANAFIQIHQVNLANSGADAAAAKAIMNGAIPGFKKSSLFGLTLPSITDSLRYHFVEGPIIAADMKYREKKIIDLINSIPYGKQVSRLLNIGYKITDNDGESITLEKS